MTGETGSYRFMAHGPGSISTRGLFRNGGCVFFCNDLLLSFGRKTAMGAIEWVEGSDQGCDGGRPSPCGSLVGQ